MRIGIRLSLGYLADRIANPFFLIMISIINISTAQNHRSREARMAKLAMRALAARHWHEPAFAKSETSWRIFQYHTEPRTVNPVLQNLPAMA
jgi:hypothetical protein